MGKGEGTMEGREKDKSQEKDSTEDYLRVLGDKKGVKGRSAEDRR